MIKLISFERRPHGYRMGIVKVLYYYLTITCEVMIDEGRETLWIRMPASKSVNDKKINCCNWDSPSDSKIFQGQVITQLAEEYPEAFEIPSKAEMNKITRQKSKSPPIGKARDKSKFDPKGYCGS
jgi:hypothetical protein